MSSAPFIVNPDLRIRVDSLSEDTRDCISRHDVYPDSTVSLSDAFEAELAQRGIIGYGGEILRLLQELHV